MTARGKPWDTALLNMLRKIFCLLLFAAGCTSTPKQGDKPLVLVSIAPYKFLVEQIGQNAIEVKTIIPIGTNPHSYEPTSKQVLEIARGQIWFRIGEPFEDKVLSLMAQRNPTLAAIDLRSGVDLLSTEGEACPHCCGLDHFDRHIWLSAKQASVQAELIAATLIEQFPDQKETFQKNLTLCQAKLQALDHEIEAILAPCNHRTIVVSHAAFGYFCNDYHLQQLSIEQEGKDPLPRHLEKMLAEARQKQVEVALALPQYNNKGVQLIAKTLHVPVRMIDPYSSDYIETMRSLAHLIAIPNSAKTLEFEGHPYNSETP